ncbi:CRISPR-associated helicase Cas3 domain protein [Gloeomargarita lithophora Alchichica-D10]|uniref:CRISPR-associated helicase Cas3 domain protein n=1 Tax=Gloeomargarita lithophora Alchichica-D10 TaxID=1188229 RepID=A0A1J0ACN8_9CYAN|nr:CRISPR-associated endonuclease Cas3'' [Gloeomargarita lithophora]APB33683.1 CRISPR-associated helicase Cas3 domain protein [Gloeomargarita lithophora Alchichica-D10]
MKYARNGQELRTHLVGTATKTASRMPDKWKNIGYYAGLWHDLGKYTDEWQTYLQKSIAGEKPHRVPHSPQGAKLALSFSKRFGQIPTLTFVIAGHHGGLKDISNYQGDEFKDKAKNWEKAKNEAIKEIEDFMPSKLPEFDVRGTSKEFAIRMLFGCLVDADRIDAAIAIENAPPDIDEASILSGLFTCFNPRHRNPSGALSSIRLEFRNDCIAKAQRPCGIFRLTGPTGIGKTLSSLEWAIAHCQANSSLTGILYVAPLRSIIDQTWQVYSESLSVNVLAHHSDFQPNQEEASDYKLTTERWNVPVICTSGVQFYESLFARTPAQCRKLSHLMNRCILIDEAQTIPLEYAKPILDVLRCLVQDWGCSVLLMSATQPTFKNIDPYFDNSSIDIIPDDKINYYFDATRRVSYQISSEQWHWQDIADRLNNTNYHQSLTIVNTTKLAKECFI